MHFPAKTIANKILHKFSFCLMRTFEVEDLLHAVEYLTLNRKPALGTRVVVFSKDRAFQLHALLTSFRLHVGHPGPVTVLYKASSKEHEAAYREVKAEFTGLDLETVSETDGFRNELLSLMGRIPEGKVLFLVDDIVFTHTVDWHVIDAVDARSRVLSLRLGENLTRSYGFRAPQECPDFTREERNGKSMLGWNWEKAEFDWAYPLSLDGHLFQTREIHQMISRVDFNGPNRLEYGLQRFIRIFRKRPGLCFPQSKLFNIPCNRVQDEVENPHGIVHQSELLRRWQNGEAMNTGAFACFRNDCCHQDVPISFVQRSNPSAVKEKTADG